MAGICGVDEIQAGDVDVTVELHAGQPAEQGTDQRSHQRSADGDEARRGDLALADQRPGQVGRANTWVPPIAAFAAMTRAITMPQNPTASPWRGPLNWAILPAT